jgi:hypothetical protein
MRQWYIRLRSGGFENGYYDINSHYELALDNAKSEFEKDCRTQGFTPLTSELVLVEQYDI